jgi:hypothetical protein
MSLALIVISTPAPGEIAHLLPEALMTNRDRTTRRKPKAAVATTGSIYVGGLSLIGAVFDHRILLIAAFATIVWGALFWCGVVLPGVWSSKKARLDSALEMVAVLLGHAPARKTRRPQTRGPQEKDQDRKNDDQLKAA